MPQEDNQQPKDWKPTQRVTLVPILDEKSTLQKKASSGKTTMIVGGVICVFGCLLTLLSGFQTLFWGAILFGGIAFLSGLTQYIKAQRNSS
jgi:hypothetical protein